MKFSIIVVIATLIFAFGAHFLLEDPGYVAINFRGYLIEMSVPVLIATFVGLVFLVWAVRKIVMAPRRIGEAAGRYRAGRAGDKLMRGMIEVAEGNFARGEKLLARAASTSDAPLFNYLQAARAAHLQGSDKRRDEWLRLAYEHTPAAANAVLLTQAELQLDRGQFEQALATLRRIDEDSRDHSYALALLGRLYYRLEDWDSLAEILPRLKKHGRITQENIDAWTARVHREMLGRAEDSDAVAAAWKQVPRNLRSHIEVLDAHFSALIRTDQHEAAEKAIVAALKSEWRGPLVRLFGLVEGPNPSKQLKRAELWLSDHGDDPDLLLAAARLCLRNELWGKARSYLESVITLRPSPEAYQEYGRLLNKLGESAAAAEAFREGLGLVGEAPKTAIPHLATDRR
jgi:HemY protein